MYAPKEAAFLTGSTIMRKLYFKYERTVIMNVNKIENGEQLTVEIEGRVDTTTAPALEAEIKGSLEGETYHKIMCLNPLWCPGLSIRHFYNIP